MSTIARAALGVRDALARRLGRAGGQGVPVSPGEARTDAFRLAASAAVRELELFCEYGDESAVVLPAHRPAWGRVKRLFEAERSLAIRLLRFGRGHGGWSIVNTAAIMVAKCQRDLDRRPMPANAALPARARLSP